MPKQKNGQNDMNKWQKVKLGDICDILDSYRVPITAKNREVGIYPYYGANGIQDYVKDFIFDGDYVLVAEDGGYFGSKTKPISYKVSGKFWVNNHAHILKAKKDIFTDYLCYSTMFYDVSSLVNGATRQKLTQAALKEIKIPLPPMEEQRKIAQRLDAVSDLLAKQKQLLSEQDNLIQSTFYDMFGTPFKNEKGFPYLQIKDLVSDVQYGTSQKADYTGKMPILRMNNITYSGEMDYTDLKYIDLEEETNKYILKKGDVLFNRTNSRELVGKTGLFNLDKLMVYAGYLIRVRLKGICLPIFLTKYMNTPQLKAFLKEKCKGIVGQANINAKEFQAIPIFLPPFELQQKFAAIVEQIESEKSKIKSAIAETQTLFNALMSEYFED